MTAMEWKVVVRARLRARTGDPALDGDVVDELADHLSQRYEETRQAGLADDVARDLVMRELAEDAGALERAVRESRGRTRAPAPPPPPSQAPWMPADVLQDVRYAARLLLRSPGFTLAAILMLALGIGATTAIFSIVDAVLLKPLPYPAADRMMAVWETDRDSGTMREPAAVPDFIDFRSHSKAFESFGGIIAAEFNLTPAGAEPERLAGAYVTSELLRMLGVAPVAGRIFTPREHELADGQQIVVSERLSRRLFATTARLPTIRLDDRMRTVIGVVPDSADTGILQWLLAADYARGFADRDARSRVDVWIPLPLDPQLYPRGGHPLLVVGRVAPGVSAEAAQGEMTAVMAALERAYPEDNQARGAHVEPFTNVVLGPVRPALWALLLAVALVLLSACVNVANLLLVRGTGRSREVAIRTALGAAPSRLTRQFIVENALLAGLAALAGVAIAAAGLQALVALAPADVPRLASVTMDLRVIGGALAVAVGMAVVFGLVPIAQAWRLDVQRALAADSGRSATGGRSRGLARSVLVVAEVALAVVLTVGAGLMIRSLWQLQQIDPGFRASRVLKAEFQLPASRYPREFPRYPNYPEMHRFNAALLEDVARLPGVEAVALAGNHPLDAGFTNSFAVVGREAEARDWPEISVRRVTPGYFRVVGVPLVRGRHLSDRDTTSAPPVVAINEAAARRFFGDRDPLGQQLSYWGAARTIVAIVGDERFHGIADAAPPAVYAPLAQSPSMNGAEALLVRAERPGDLGGALRAAIGRQDPALAVFGVEPLEVTLAESVGQQRFVMLLLTVFAGVALLLAAAGIHAVLSYDVAQRTREIGIRLALGALPSGVTRLIVRRGAILAAVGLAIGAVGSLAMVGLIRSLLFDVAPGDPVTLVAVVLLLGGVALAASYLPARRAVRTDPLVALRDE
jgi:putative ABC transport system permease protein